MVCSNWSTRDFSSSYSVLETYFSLRKSKVLMMGGRSGVEEVGENVHWLDDVPLAFRLFVTASARAARLCSVKVEVRS